ncbi:MAG: PKD domain-containing protein [Muribaculaceae bacterium]|nr:PKD domain-containing protein [Muribaculaceae bacterium]
MNFINKLAIFGLGVFALTSCVDKEAEYQVFPDPDVDFSYEVAGDEYTLDYYVVSHIQFNNKSAKTGTFTWDFGDGTTSNEVSPVHKYTKAGQYTVKLTLDNGGYKELKILIIDITPTLSIEEQSDDIICINETKVSFHLTLPNPENLRCRYEWTFPEGTKDAAGNPMTTFIGYAESDGTIQYPGDVTFSNIGSQKIEIKTFFDIDGENRRLDDSYLNVQVGSPIEAPTLYYAEKDGNIKALKLIDSSLLPKGTKILPYDMGVKSGNNPFNICYGETDATDEEGNTIKEGWIYILDAGKQYYYVSDENGTLGDGQITAMRVDGTGVNTVITNVGGYAFNDPFQGFVADGKLYYSDRNTGVSEVLLTDRGQKQNANSAGNRDSYVFQNDRIPYYNRGISYGAIHAGMCRDSKGMWYWAKYYNSSQGIFRFKQEDIYTTAAEATAAPSPYSILIAGAPIRTFCIDEDRNALYVWRIVSEEGFHVYNLPAPSESLSLTDSKVKISMSADPVNTTANEGVFTTQLALDKETGRVYFGFRPLANDDSKLGQGIVYYDPDTKKCARYGETSDAIYGVCINPNKTKLF